MKSTEELCKEAAKDARAKTVEMLEKKGPSIELVLRRLKQSLNAKTQRVFFDGKNGEIKYSKKLIDHGSRLKAIDLAAELWDIKPSKKHEVEHDLRGNTMAMVAQVINKGKTDGSAGD